MKWMQHAAETAKRSLCLRAYCGTVIVKEGEIIGKGYNAPPLDDLNQRICLEKPSPHGKPTYDRTCCLHAEWRALFDALKNNPTKLAGSQLFFTRVDQNGEITKSGKPYCTVCSRLSLDSGVKEFVLWHEEGIAVYTTAEYNTLSYNYIHEEK